LSHISSFYSNKMSSTTFSPSFFSSSTEPSKPFSLDSFWLPISPRAQSHLLRVYSTLCLAVVGAAIGSSLHLYYHIGGMITHLLSFALICAIAVDRAESSYTTPHTHIAGLPRRVWMLFALGVCQGASIGPLVELAIYMDPTIILMAFILTANIFVCFSLTALYIPHRSTFAFASILSSSLSFLVLISFFSLFFPSVWAYKIQLYLGLAIFSGYILFDTQKMIDRAESGRVNGDVYVDDALELFTNLIAVFIRVLIILMEQKGKDSKEQGKRRAGRR